MQLHVRHEHQDAKDEFHHHSLAQRWATITTDRSNTLRERRGHKGNAMTRTRRSHEETITGAGLAGLLVIQIIIGYEWLVSGVTKLWRGGFANGLAGELRDKSHGVASWYKGFLNDVVIPHGWAVGWIVLVAEILVGVVLMVGAIVWLARWSRLSVTTRRLLVSVVAIAAIGAIVMNVTFHLANGAPHPWLIPKEGFDEGVDLDSLMPLVETVLVVANLRFLSILRSAERRRADFC
jgi:thiosulfate dehydrogenase [quinone] large subunit